MEKIERPLRRHEIDNRWFYQKWSRRGHLGAYFRFYVKNQRQLYRFFKTARLMLVLGPLRRPVVAYYRWRNKNPILPTEPRSLFPDLNVTEAVDAIARKGVVTGLRAPAEAVAEIREYCASHEVYIAADKKFSIAYSPQEPPVKHVHVYRYLSPHERCEAVRKLAYDPKLVEIVTGYFGTNPIVYDTEIYWCFPKNPQNSNTKSQDELDDPFHYESGDFLSLTAFIYLSDVDEDCGPHVVIQGTHRHKTLRQLFNCHLSAQAAKTAYADRMMAIFGSRGAGFIEDLSAYHKRSIGLKPRLILGIHYTIRRRDL